MSYCVSRQEADLIGRLESKLADDFGRASSLGPTPSPAASSSAHDSSADFYQLQGTSEHDAAVLVSGVAGEYEEVDVERWGEGEGGGEGVDLLLEDLQASSNSEDEGSEDRE